MKNERCPETYLLQLSAFGKNHKPYKRFFGDVPSCLPSNRFCKLLYWTCRKIQFWLCFYDNDVEIDIEDLLKNPFNTQPPSLHELIRATDFNKEWIMFMYRNFKQICSNGRMALQQWRRIFQLIFPKSVNTEFADRIFQVIAGSKSRKHITFEELILCLHRISECYCAYASTSSQTSSAHFTRMAKFVFLLMEPNDQKKQINLDAFENYVEAVFSLNIPSTSYNSNYLFSQMDISGNFSTAPMIPFQLPPNVKHYASQCFSDMDMDNDGFITVEDVERMLTSECDKIRLFKESHLLHS